MLLVKLSLWFMKAKIDRLVETKHLIVSQIKQIWILLLFRRWFWTKKHFCFVIRRQIFGLKSNHFLILTIFQRPRYVDFCFASSSCATIRANSNITDSKKTQIELFNYLFVLHVKFSSVFLPKKILLKFFN